MANKSIGDYTAANSIDATADYLLIQQSGVYKKINRNTVLALASAPLGTTDIQSPTNKTFDNTNTVTLKGTKLTLQDDSDTTKQARFLMSSITAGNIRSYTLPDASATLVGTTTTQTLTNKTLTSPAITGGTIDNSTVTVDSVAGHTVATTVTVANLQIANGVLNTANAVTATSIAAGAIQPQALVSGTGSGWTWQSYTPTFANTTKGAGVVTGLYAQTGKTVIGLASFVLANDGSSAVGTAPTVTLPVTATSSGYSSLNSTIGTVSLADQGVSLYDAVLLYNSTTVATIQAKLASGTYVSPTAITATVPFTWGNNDGLYVNFCYQAA